MMTPYLFWSIRFFLLLHTFWPCIACMIKKAEHCFTSSNQSRTAWIKKTSIQEDAHYCCKIYLIYYFFYIFIFVIVHMEKFNLIHMTVVTSAFLFTTSINMILSLPEHVRVLLKVELFALLFTHPISDALHFACKTLFSFRQLFFTWFLQINTQTSYLVSNPCRSSWASITEYIRMILDWVTIRAYTERALETTSREAGWEVRRATRNILRTFNRDNACEIMSVHSMIWYL